jgi:hypothetical protein
MSEPTVRFPVACPMCGRERLTEIPVDVVADALRRGSDICLVATCHDVIWAATELELEQIHEYLGAVHPGRCSCGNHGNQCQSLIRMK